ncbi:alanine racemase [bacterium]|nr:alanine racemase [bacterium]
MSLLSPAVAPVVAPAPTIRPTRAVVDLAAIRHNLEFIRRRIGSRCGIMAVVKADGYGHGMVDVAREAARWGVQGIAVATVDEALTLRESKGLEEMPILVAGPSFPDDADLLQRAGISVTIGTIELLRQHLAIARRRGVAPRLHLKVDTGMGRYGFRPDRLTFLDLFGPMPQALEGLMTHFSVSDSLNQDDVDYTISQRQRFEFVARRVHKFGFRPVVHAANSGAVLHHEESHYELVRPGVLLYGAHPDPSAGGLPLKQAMTLATRIVAIHDRPAGASISYGRRYVMPEHGRLGILPIGYGDGLPRCYGDGGQVLIRGRRVPIVGRVCMDQTIVDLSKLPEGRVGDEVVLYGSQGGERISLEEVARIARTIPYEITCQLGGRVPRIVIDSHETSSPAPAGGLEV